MAQESALAEVVKGAGHIFELYPKFHCETNWIERYWGAVKREARLNYEYTLSALRVNLPVFCDRVSPVDAVPIKIRRFHNRCWRYIDAYSKLDSSGNPNTYNAASALVDKFTSRKMTSHRRLNRDE